MRGHLVLVALCVLAAAGARADQVDDCARLAMSQLKHDGSDITRVEIPRDDSFYDNKFEGKIGSQFVSSEYFGKARLTSPKGVQVQRFVCLHEGLGKRPLYFALIPD